MQADQAPQELSGGQRATGRNLLPPLIFFGPPGTYWSYLTLKDRIPKIVLDIINDSSNMPEHRKDALLVLYRELQQFGTIRKIAGDREEAEASQDIDEWAGYLKDYGKGWLDLPYFVGEAYLYRRVMMEMGYFAPGETKLVDPFEKSKRKGNMDTLSVMENIAVTLHEFIDKIEAEKKASSSAPATITGDNKSSSAWSLLVREGLRLFLLRSLWGNKADLSLFSIAEDPLVLAKKLKDKQQHQGGIKEGGEGETAHDGDDELDYLLTDSSETICSKLEEIGIKKVKGALRLDIIVDNAGLELFSDLCFAHYLVEVLDAQVHIHLKRDPTFVSDAMPKDVHNLIAILKERADDNANAKAHHLNRLIVRWNTFINDGRWQLKDNRFWNSPLFFSELSSSENKLCQSLAGDLREADMVFIKGDANYRRLVGDYYWPHHTPIETTLAKDFPAQWVVSLRVLKSEVAIGLDNSVVEKLRRTDPSWMVNGKWAQIQFVDVRRET